MSLALLRGGKAGMTPLDCNLKGSQVNQQRLPKPFFFLMILF